MFGGQKVRHVFWLSLESRSYWDTGDSIVREYGTFWDGLYECRNLRSLKRLVEQIAWRAGIAPMPR